MTDPDQTDFGFKNVATNEKQKLVANVFHSVASRYDIMNDLMSLGIHRIWKRITASYSPIQPGHNVLDIAGGTGDLTRLFLKKVGDTGSVTLADINDSMIRMGRSKLDDGGFVKNIRYVQANAESLPFPDNHFDCISIAFGLRNVTHKDQALRSMFRTLKPGGQLLILEFSKPTLPFIEPIYDWYSFNILPKVGAWVTGDADSYQYLAESIRKHPDQDTLKNMVLDAGFEHCDYHNLTGGIVTIHQATKASEI